MGIRPVQALRHQSSDNSSKLWGRAAQALPARLPVTHSPRVQGKGRQHLLAVKTVWYKPDGHLQDGQHKGKQLAHSTKPDPCPREFTEGRHGHPQLTQARSRVDTVERMVFPHTKQSFHFQILIFINCSLKRCWPWWGICCCLAKINISIAEYTHFATPQK